MTKLLFVRQPHVYLPEITAYKSYLSSHYPSVEAFESTDFQDGYDLAEFDIAWHFMGRDMKGAGRYVIHEYNSLSTKPFAQVKNQIKRIFNAKPDRRVFLNNTVRNKFGFNDAIPYSLRDMGVDDAFFQENITDTPEYDFIYAGGLNRGAVIERFLEHFSKNMQSATLILVGDASDCLRAKFKGFDNITFKGRVSYKEVPKLMANARYGLNIMPDEYPFNIQTATKVLEYMAVGLPVVTTNYQWINEFEAQHKGRFFKLSPDMSNLSLDSLSEFEFVTPDIKELSWGNVIEKSNVFSFL